MNILWRILNIVLTIVVVIAALPLSGLFYDMGRIGDASLPPTLFWCYVTVCAPLLFLFGYVELMHQDDSHEAVITTRKRIDSLSKELATAGSALEKYYWKQRKGVTQNKILDLHAYCKAQYKAKRSEHLQTISQLFSEWDGRPWRFRLWDAAWKLLLTIGVLGQFAACSYTVGTEDLEPSETITVKNWTAKDITLPHLTDRTKYVSNPDSVISLETVNRLNRRLLQMDEELGIETALVAVRHVENKDIFRFAQDVFDLYGVGKSDDRGLVMVLAYDDHLFRTHTGYGLEADLTDIECNDMQARYLIPYLKVNQPDSALLALTDAFYHKLKHLPQTAAPSVSAPKKQTTDDEPTDYVSYYFFFLIIWTVAYFIVSIARGWNMRVYAHNQRSSNLFRKEIAVFPSLFGGSWVPSSSFWGGGGFSGDSSSGGRSSSSGRSYRSSGGGGYGGGRSGGGGSTSSW